MNNGEGERLAFWCMQVMIVFLGACFGVGVAQQLQGTPGQGAGWGAFVGLMISTVLIIFAMPDSSSGEEGDAPSRAPPQRQKARNRDAERERDEQLAELKAERLDPITEEAQRQEIEATYQRKRSDA